MHKQPKILRYRKDQRLLQRFGCNYEVGLQFALHVGWAIEGATGSEHKIDVSFVGPHIDRLKLLLKAAERYGAHILLSEEFHSNCSYEMQKRFCRRMDRARFASLNLLTDLYTVDVDMNSVTPPADKSKKYPDGIYHENDIDIKRELNMTYLDEDSEVYNAEEFVRVKKELRQALLSQSHLEDFRMHYEMGLESYLAGEWASAQTNFTRALKFVSEDAPTRHMLSLLGDRTFACRDFPRCTVIA